MGERPLRVGFWMDPLSGIQVGHDTTFALMLECQRRGHDVRCFEGRHLFARGSQPGATMQRVRLSSESGQHVTVLEESAVALSTMDVLFLRKDPPVNEAFLLATQLVELGPGPHPAFINSPTALRTANEKLFALKWPTLVPRTVVAQGWRDILAFTHEVGGQAVLKPISGFGGRGVVKLSVDDKNMRSIVEVLTDGGTRHVVVQQFLSANQAGDKRILLLDGKPIGAVLRVPSGEDFRCNLAAGGQAVRTALSEREREICDAIGPTLSEMGLHFVGIDVIGGLLTEVNVTSPTGLMEVNRLEQVALERQVIDFAETLADPTCVARSAS